MDTEMRHRGSKPKYNDEDEEEKELLDQSGEYKEEKAFEDDFIRIPWKGILFALVLNLIGCSMLGVYFLSFFGVIDFYPEDPLSYFIITFLTLVPGTYHTMVAIRAYRGDEGFTFDCFY